MRSVDHCNAAQRRILNRRRAQVDAAHIQPRRDALPSQINTIPAKEMLAAYALPSHIYDFAPRQIVYMKAGKHMIGFIHHKAHEHLSLTASPLGVETRAVKWSERPTYFGPFRVRLFGSL
jgi:hypothetical protein